VLGPRPFSIAPRFTRRGWLQPVVLTTAAVRVALGAYGIAADNHKTYYSLVTRAWELFVGVGLAIHFHNRPVTTSFFAHPRVREFLATAALAAIAVPCFAYDHKTPFPGPAALPPVLGAMVLIALGGDAARKTWVHKLLSTHAAVYIGLISYSLYLWHWPLIVYYKHLHIAPPSNLEKLMIVLASLALADLTRRLIGEAFPHGAVSGHATAVLRRRSRGDYRAT